MGTRGPGIVLIGLRRAGKSLVGESLAQGIGGQFIDLDLVIAKAVGQPTGDYLAQVGEPAFRLEESRCLQSRVDHEEARRQQAAAETLAVLATGGGTPTLAENRELLRRWGRVVYLHASKAELVRRSSAEDARQRPLLGADTVAGETEALMRRRNPLYSCFADVIVNADEGVAEVVKRCRYALSLI